MTLYYKTNLNPSPTHALSKFLFSLNWPSCFEIVKSLQTDTRQKVNRKAD